MRLYHVTQTLARQRVVEVEATNKAEAEEKARSVPDSQVIEWDAEERLLCSEVEAMGVTET